MIENKRYIDIDFDFKAHPVSGDLVLKKNEEAIKKSVKSLIMTSKYDRPFQPSINSKVRDLLFENMTPVTGVNLKSNIENVLRQHEPRISIVGIDVFQDDNNNSIDVTISFAINNQPEVVTQTILLERTR